MLFYYKCSIAANTKRSNTDLPAEIFLKNFTLQETNYHMRCIPKKYISGICLRNIYFNSLLYVGLLLKLPIQYKYKF